MLKKLGFIFRTLWYYATKRAFWSLKHAVQSAVHRLKWRGKPLDVHRMWKWEFKFVPLPEWPSDWESMRIDSLVIVPAKALHDSGYCNMEYVGCVGCTPLFRTGGHSDVLHIHGIGGFGHRWYTAGLGVPKMVPPAGWMMDCLPRSGCLRLFTANGAGDQPLFIDAPLSSVSVYYDAAHVEACAATREREKRKLRDEPYGSQPEDSGGKP